MQKSSLLIGMCLMLALALNVWAYQQRSHPEIMQEIAQTRPQLQNAVDAGDAEAAAEAAMQLEGLFQEVIPIYERIGNMAPAIAIANKASAAAMEAANAAKANNLEAAGTAHGMVQKACGGCHSQFREKTEDGSYRIKAQ